MNKAAVPVSAASFPVILLLPQVWQSHSGVTSTLMHIACQWWVVLMYLYISSILQLNSLVVLHSRKAQAIYLHRMGSTTSSSTQLCLTFDSCHVTNIPGSVVPLDSLFYYSPLPSGVPVVHELIRWCGNATLCVCKDWCILVVQYHEYAPVCSSLHAQGISWTEGCMTWLKPNLARRDFPDKLSD